MSLMFVTGPENDWNFDNENDSIHFVSKNAPPYCDENFTKS